jgi:head-to-tail connecting protein
MYDTAAQCWGLLNGMKTTFMDRVERYAALTIPKLCLPLGFNTLSTDQTHDYQSAGAQGTNHLTNKIMLALFAPSRPFFRLAGGKKTQNQLAAAGATPETIDPVLSKMERDAVATLDSRGQRPKLYQCIRHLIVTGNVLLILGDTDMRVMGLRYWCVKRNWRGQVQKLIIRECMKWDELSLDVRTALGLSAYTDETEVEFYRYITRNDDGDYEMTQWVNTIQLPAAFNGKWKEENLPYRVLTWDLGDDSDYATGLVEEYAGDLEAMSVLSESVVDGAVLGTEYRWLVNPTGVTSADDMAKTHNGDCVAGKPEDIAPTQGGNPMAIKIADDVLQRYEKRVGMGFLMQSAVTRDAERVTAEEVRQTAMELETSFGGVYSTLAQDIQHPIAVWLLKAAGTDVTGTDIKISVITGLDALSRNGDIENLRACFGDLAGTAQLPPEILGRIKFDQLLAFIGDGRGIDLRPYIMSDAEYAQSLQQQAQQQANVAGAVASKQAIGQAQGQLAGQQAQPAKYSTP